jgi:hypothetical protein
MMKEVEYGANSVYTFYVNGKIETIPGRGIQRGG